MARGEGLRTWDVDGNEYRDFLGNYTSLILGHAHPAVVEAVTAQVRRGSAFAAPTEVEIELAEEIRRRLPSVERLRFTNSGTEATMFAIRAARAFTGRTLVARFDGAYHGTHDTVLPGTPGVPDAVSGLVDRPAVGRPRRHRARAGRPRALESRPSSSSRSRAPAASGPPIRRSSGSLREMTSEIGAVLIFDEIIAFRIGPNGAQGVFGVTPDLTTLGKIIGGGYALAAFGGRAEIMDRFDARRPGALSHGGTFNGNPVAAAAGLATLRELTPDRYDRLAELGERLRVRLAADIRRRRHRRAGRRHRARCSRCSPGRRSRARASSRRARPCSSGCSSTGSTSRRAGWARSRRRRPKPTSTTWPTRSSGGWPRCSRAAAAAAR